jgi:hypothetical protein
MELVPKSPAGKPLADIGVELAGPDIKEVGNTDFKTLPSASLICFVK